uniref:Tc1-like transposase DDE domain-containing protein n=1 Tax=Seriola dumerili TaxID=41447 RepID=A0A3B4VJM2_SERDU
NNKPHIHATNIRCYPPSTLWVDGHFFQHDNDPKPSSKATDAFLRKNKVKVLQWPNMSPDLNPTEQLWGILRRQVEQQSPLKHQGILQEWNAIDRTIYCELVHSTPRSVGAVLTSKGGHTKL